MAQDIGTAYVSVMPSARGFGKAVEGEVDSGLGGATKKADGRLKTLAKNTAKWGAVAVGAVAATITGLAVKGGISRALNIEDAQAKLQGLGHDAKTLDQIMTDALASVRGTAYGLDTAATVAASAVAAGIKPGRELENYLRLTADAATIAGISMDEMGGIINKVTANGKAMTENLYQLQDRGIPIMQWLAEEYGVSADELSKMVSRGEVDAETYRKVIEDNIGGAALASGDTTRGAFANMGAALSRLGLTVVQPFVDNAKGLFGELTTLLDGLNDRIGPFAEQFATWFNSTVTPAMEGFGERALGAFDGALNALTVFTDALKGLSEVGEFEGILGALNDIGATIHADGFITGVVSLIQQSIQAGADWLADGGIQTLVDAFIAGRQALFGAVVKIVPGILDALLTIVPALGDMVVSMVSALAALLPEVIATLVAMIPQILDTALTVFMALVDALVTIIPVLIRTVFDILPGLIQTLLGMIPQLLRIGLELFTSLIDAVLTILPDLLMTLVTEVLPSLITTLLDMIPVLLEAAIDTFIALVDALVEVLPMLIDTLIGEVLPSLIETLIGMVPKLISTAITVFLALLTGIIRAVPKIVGGLWDAIGSLIGALVKSIPQFLSAGKDLLDGIWQGLVDAWPAIWDWIKSLPGEILKALGNLNQLLLGAGKKIIDGLWNGIKSGFNKVKDGLRDFTDKITGWKGPPERDEVLLTGAGQLIMGGFLDGLQDGEGAVKRYLQGLTSELAIVGTASFDASSVPTRASNGGQVTVNANNVDEAAVAREIMRAQAMLVG